MGFPPPYEMLHAEIQTQHYWKCTLIILFDFWTIFHLTDHPFSPSQIVNSFFQYFPSAGILTSLSLIHLQPIINFRWSKFGTNHLLTVLGPPSTVQHTDSKQEELNWSNNSHVVLRPCWLLDQLASLRLLLTFPSVSFTYNFRCYFFGWLIPLGLWALSA